MAYGMFRNYIYHHRDRILGGFHREPCLLQTHKEKPSTDEFLQGVHTPLPGDNDGADERPSERGKVPAAVYRPLQRGVLPE